jgi:hypothetical protein
MTARFDQYGGTDRTVNEVHAEDIPRFLSPSEMDAAVASAPPPARQARSPRGRAPSPAPASLSAMDWVEVLLATDRARAQLTQYPDGPAHWIGALLFLGTQPGGEARQEAVRGAMGTSESSASNFVAACGAGKKGVPGRGWVAARVDPDNHRQNLVRLTESGRSVVNALATAAHTEAQARLATASARKTQ